MPACQDALRERYINSLHQIFSATKGFLIKVPENVARFRENEPLYADKVLAILVDKGLVYPTTLQRTQIRGDIDSIYNALSRAERWKLDSTIPDDFNPLWGELQRLYPTPAE
jgi:hypothetical protein